MKIICIGRNYVDHAKELNNPVPEQPVVFMKPPSALLINDKPFYHPDFTEDVHYELEVVLKIGKNGRHVQPEFASSYFSEVTLGIDFTARDVQSKLKAKGHPWELAKGFDGSAAIGNFVRVDQLNRQAIPFHLLKNGEKVQEGNTKDMIFTFEEIIVFVSKFFKLQMGDLIFTGTPAGVGPIKIGDKLEGFISMKQETRKLMTCEIK